MDITNIECRWLKIPLAGEYSISSATSQSINTFLVIIETADGERGIGTADTTGVHPVPQTPAQIFESLVDELLPNLMNRQPATPTQLYQFISQYPGYVNATSALEMAFLDLHCRSTDQTIAEHFGGALHTPEPLNAWVGVDSPEAMASEAESWLERGFTGLKIKVTGDPEPDIARIRAVCERVGNAMDVRVDANEGYTSVEDALRVAREMESLPIVHFEQPIHRDDVSGLKRLTHSTSVTVMADEPVTTVRDAAYLVWEGAADRLKFKVLKQGGLQAVHRALHLAEAADMQCVVGHGFCSSPAMSAELQLTSTHESVLRPVESVGVLKFSEEPFAPQVTVTDGAAQIPSGSGHGVRISDYELLDSYTTDAREITGE